MSSPRGAHYYIIGQPPSASMFILIRRPENL